MASSDQRAQKPIRVRGCSRCPHHRGKQVICVCETCKELVCVSCVCKLHRGHEFEELGDAIPNAKTKIQNFIDSSENHELPRIKGKIQDMDSEMSSRKHYYNQEIRRMKMQNEILVEELNKATRNLVKSYRDIEKQEMDIIRNHKTALQANADGRSSLIQECKDSLLSGNDVQVYDFSNDLPSEIEDIPTPALPNPPKFTPKELEKLVDEVTKSAARVSLNKPLHQATNYSVVSQFHPLPYCIKSINPGLGNTAWISFLIRNDNGDINRMLLVNHNGEVQQTLDMEIRVDDICVSPGSGIIFLRGYDDHTRDNTVREVRGRGSLERFTTDKQTLSICLTADDHVVIGHDQEVVKYTQTGKVIHKTPGGDKPLMIFPNNISQCPNTGHLAVVDLDIQMYGGSDQPVVLVLDDQLNPLYKYCGDTSGGQPLTQPFDPWDVCYTANRSLVITEISNKCVLLVNEKGEYLQTVYTHSDSKPFNVCVHNDGVLLVSFNDGSVKLLKSE